MKKDQHLKIRTTKETIDKVDKLVEYYNDFSIGTINKTTIVELAINELYEKFKKTMEQAKVR